MQRPEQRIQNSGVFLSPTMQQARWTVFSLEIRALSANGLAMTERAYKMTRLGPGDYLLPSNDAQTLWRLCTYTEDWGDDTHTDGWGIWRWSGGFQRRAETFPDLEDVAFALAGNDWTVWEFWAGPFSKRTEAIESALR